MTIKAVSATLGSGYLTDLASGDMIDIGGMSGLTGQARSDGGLLQVSDATHAVSIQLAGTFRGLAIAAGADPEGGLLLRFDPGT
ncbi:MAG: hypothetical protein NVSMB18_01780 [Acetobacteraceae bacterium]